jgi:hypothetical protein
MHSFASVTVAARRGRARWFAVIAVVMAAVLLPTGCTAAGDQLVDATFIPVSPVSTMPSSPDETGNSMDDETLDQLAALSDLSEPRDWTHYLYFDDGPSALAAADQATEDGWDLVRLDIAETRDSWVVIMEQKNVVVTPQLVRETRHYFEDLAASAPGGLYDGWEASV